MVAIFVPPRMRITDANGVPVSGALVTFYTTGTTTLKSIYQDADMTVAHTNPVEADSGGLLPVIYLEGAYKIKVTDADGNQIHPEADDLDAPLSSDGGTLGISEGGTGASDAATARTNLSVPSQSAFDALSSDVGDIQSTINDYPTFGSLAAKSEIEPGDLSNDFAPVCIQRQITLNSVRSSYSGSIPLDNTAPLKNEGDTIFSENFTPIKATTTIRVRVVLHLSGSSRDGAIALFNTIGASDASIAAVGVRINSTTVTEPFYLEHEFSSPGTSQITIQVNAGASGTYYLNGSSTAGLFNSVMSSRLIIEEYETV